MIRRALAVFRKEMLEGTRDRRSATAALMYALVGPLVLYTVLTALARDAAPGGPAEVLLTGATAVPGLVDVLREHGIVPGGEASAVKLAVPEDFVGSLGDGEIPHVVITADMDRSEATVTRIREALAAYGQTVTSQRLVARGVASLLTRPFTVDVHDVGAVDRRSRIIVNAIVIVLLGGPFFAGIALASDSTAGERERFSLLPLLSQPVRPAEVVVGKWLAVSIAAALGSFATALGSAYVVDHVPLTDLGLHLGVGLEGTVVLVLLFVPLSMVVAAAQLLIALGSRTYKEGQTYLTLFSFVPFLVALLGTSSFGERWIGAPFPVFWEIRKIGQLLAGESVAVMGVAAALAVYAGLTALALAGVVVQMRRAVASAG